MSPRSSSPLARPRIDDAPVAKPQLDLAAEVRLVEAPQPVEMLAGSLACTGLRQQPHEPDACVTRIGRDTHRLFVRGERRIETACRGVGIPSPQERCAQPFTKRRVGGDDGHRLPKHRHRFGHALARNEVRHDAPEFDGRQIRITACRRGPCSVDARGHVAEVERAEP